MVSRCMAAGQRREVRSRRSAPLPRPLTHCLLVKQLLEERRLLLLLRQPVLLGVLRCSDGLAKALVICQQGVKGGLQGRGGAIARQCQA